MLLLLCHFWTKRIILVFCPPFSHRWIPRRKTNFNSLNFIFPLVRSLSPRAELSIYNFDFRIKFLSRGRGESSSLCLSLSATVLLPITILNDLNGTTAVEDIGEILSTEIVSRENKFEGNEKNKRRARFPLKLKTKVNNIILSRILHFNCSFHCFFAATASASASESSDDCLLFRIMTNQILFTSARSLVRLPSARPIHGWVETEFKLS